MTPTRALAIAALAGVTCWLAPVPPSPSARAQHEQPTTSTPAGPPGDSQPSGIDVPSPPSPAPASSGNRLWIDSLAGTLSPTVRALDARRAELAQQLAGLPNLPTRQQSARVGFHSSYASSASLARWVQVDLGKGFPIDGIALIPAHLVSGSQSEAGYGFPARFRIDVSDDGGFRTFQSVADHTETDLPNPGDYPYYVATPGVRGRYVRVTATKLWRGKDEWLFALGELVVLSGGRNVAAGKAVRATGDRTQEIPPAWSKGNLVDSQSVLGTPVEAEASSTNGYHSAVASSPDVTKWVQVDLRRRVPLDEIRLIPARPSMPPDFAGYGFPVRFRVEVAEDAECQEAVTLLDHTTADFVNPGDNSVVAAADGQSGRFVRVTVTRLGRRDNYFFTLAELQVISEGKNVALGCPVTALDSYAGPKRYWDPSYLVDGYNSRGRLADWPEWLSGLARRRELESSLQELDRQREQAADAFLTRATAWSGGGVGALALALLLASYRSRAARKREVERLRNRIAGDLHDEIGSNLGSIALLSQLAQTHAADGAEAQREFAEINRVALQTVESMRDIVWFINPACATRSDLYARMREVAATLLSGLPYQFESPERPAKGNLSLEFRRHVFLIFKEALYNVVKHARATSVAIAVAEEHGKLLLRISDNGMGFDVADTKAGNGLKSLRQRAASLYGTLTIESSAGQGTTVSFTAKIT